MLGSGYFGPSYFGSGYFGTGGTAVVTPPATRPLTAEFAPRNFDVLFHENPLMPRHVVIRRGELREPILATLRHAVTVAGIPEQQPFPIGDRTVTARVRNIESGAETTGIATTVVNPAAVEPEDAHCGEVTIALSALAALADGQYDVGYTAGSDGDTQRWPTFPGLTLTIHT